MVGKEDSVFIVIVYDRGDPLQIGRPYLIRCCWTIAIESTSMQNTIGELVEKASLRESLAVRWE